jgi:hypothetical protein
MSQRRCSRVGSFVTRNPQPMALGSVASSCDAGTQMRVFLPTPASHRRSLAPLVPILAVAFVMIAASCAEVGGAAPTSAPSVTVAPTALAATPTPTAQPPTRAQLVALAKRVYFDENGRLSDCALSSGSFSGYHNCPFTTALLAKFAPSPQDGDALACASEAVQPAPTGYMATPSDGGGTVQVAVPATPAIRYTLNIIAVSSELQVSDISFMTQGQTSELTDKTCASKVVPVTPSQ